MATVQGAATNADHYRENSRDEGCYLGRVLLLALFEEDEEEDGDGNGQGIEGEEHDEEVLPEPSEKYGNLQIRQHIVSPGALPVQEADSQVEPVEPVNKQYLGHLVPLLRHPAVKEPHILPIGEEQIHVEHGRPDKHTQVDNLDQVNPDLPAHALLVLGLAVILLLLLQVAVVLGHAQEQPEGQAGYEDLLAEVVPAATVDVLDLLADVGGFGGGHAGS